MAVKMNAKSRCFEDENNNNMQLTDDKTSQEELKHFLLGEIENLEEEIKDLEDETDLQERVSVGEFSEDVLRRISCDLERTGYLKNQQTEDQPEEKQVRLKLESLEALTGIRFENNKLHCSIGTGETERQKGARKGDGSSSTWRRHLSGKCYSLPFSVDFIVEEITTEDDSPATKEETQEIYKAKITKLNIMVSNSIASKELNSFINITKKEKALCPFFQALIQYGEWHQHRQRTFSHFKAKYPHSVHLISGEQGSTSMQLINPVRPGFVFTVGWELKIGDTGIVRPEIDIYTYCTSQTGQPSGVKSLPEHFRKMLSVLGIEQAIESIIGIVLR